MYIIKKMPNFSTPWTSWKVKWFLKVWSACSKVLHSLSPQLFTLPALPPFSVNLHLLKVCHPSEVSFPAYIISLLNCSSPQLTCAVSPALFLVLSTFFPVLCGLWPLLHRAATTAPALFCKLHVASMGVLVCSPKPPLVPLRQLAWLLHFWRVLPFPAPLHMFDVHIWSAPLSSSSSSSPTCHLAVAFVSPRTALLQSQPPAFPPWALYFSVLQVLFLWSDNSFSFLPPSHFWYFC